MKSYPKFHVKKRTLLVIAGIVWIIAGVNVSRMGVLAYFLVGKVSSLNLVLSLAVFGGFGAIFYKMSAKHSKRIQSYKEPTKAFWHFFDLKAYSIMAFMMSGGIWLRSSGLISSEFIAVFYTGVGFALTSAGISVCRMYFTYSDTKDCFS